MSLAVDTLQLAKNLAEAGMDRAQAEVLSSALPRGLRDGDIATKSDLEEPRKSIKAEIDGVRKDLKAEIDCVRRDLRTESDGVRKDQKIESAGLRTEMIAARNQTILAMIAIAGLALAIIRVMP